MKTNNQILWLQNWYKEKCNDEWEHSYGIKIDTIDNPGWVVEIDLAMTNLDNIRFTPIIKDVDDNNWINCSIKNKKFIGIGGSENLIEILEVFQKLVES